MIDFLLSVDKKLTILLNSYHSAFWDDIIYNLTGIKFWIPLFIIVLYLIYKQEGDLKKVVMWLIIFSGVIIFTDVVSARVFKPFFKRLRPCNDREISSFIHIVRGYCSKSYSFVSSHATNSFGIFGAAFFFRKYLPRYVSIILLLWSLFFSYTRIYLGVHFVGDVLGGFLLGFILSSLYCKLLNYFLLRKILV